MEIVCGGFCISTNFAIPKPHTLTSFVNNAFFPRMQVELTCIGDRCGASHLIETVSIDPDSFYLTNKNDILYVSKNKIVYKYKADIEKDYKELTKTVFKNGIGLASYLHGRTVLHGNVFSIGTKAYAIIGPSGSGKSSLTAAMIRYCHASLLSEDSVYLDYDGLTTYSGTRELYLFPDSAVNIIGKNGIRNKRGKYSFFYSGSEECKTTYQLAGILILHDDKSADLLKYHQIEKVHALRILLNNIRYKSVLDRKYLINSIGILSKTLSSIPVFEVSLRKEYQYLHEQVLSLYEIIIGGR